MRGRSPRIGTFSKNSVLSRDTRPPMINGVVGGSRAYVWTRRESTCGADARIVPFSSLISRSASGVREETMASTIMLTSLPSALMRGRILSMIPSDR